MTMLALAPPIAANPTAPQPPANLFGFYLVWNPNGRSPKRRHATLKEAQAEAERLALKHKNQSFYVMRSMTVDRCYIEDMTVRGTTHFYHESTPVDPHLQ